MSDATETAAPAAAMLTITRDAPDDVQDRWVRVVIDGRPEEILRYGHVLRSEIAPGRHEIKAHNTLSSDVLAFDAAPGQAVHVRCYNRVAKGGVLMMLTTGFAFISVRLELAADPVP